MTNPLFVKRYGTGERVIVGLHGWNGSHQSFDAILPFMPEDVSFYCLDLPGYGQSPEPQKWTVEEISRILAKWLQTLPTKEIEIIGSCSGALWGLAAAMQSEQFKIKRFVLVDAFAYVPFYFRLFLYPIFGPIAYFSTFHNPIGRWITNQSLRHKRTEETDLTHSFTKVAPLTPYRYLRLLNRIRNYLFYTRLSEDKLTSNEASTAFFPGTEIVLLSGEKSFQAIKSSVGMWRKLWPSAKAHVLNGAGHLPVQEAPEQLAKVAFEGG